MLKRNVTLSLSLLCLVTLIVIIYQRPTSKTTADLVIIDESLQDYRSLAAGLAPGSQVMYVSNSRDGFKNLVKQLSAHGKAERVHIMTHGTKGNFVLGQTQLNEDNMHEHNGFWKSLGNVLVSGKSSLMIYSCQLTSSRDGEGFVQRLHRQLGVPVAASNDLTGSDRRGGDWDLEYVAGKILKQHVLKLMNFKGLLVPTYSQAVSPFSGMTIATGNQLIYGDFDSDGDIDIHSYDGSSATNDFWQNNGSGTFAKVTGTASPFQNIFENAVFYSAQNAFVADWDNDGDDDIYVPMRSTQANEKNFYYRNDNGKYVLRSGADSPFNGIEVSGNNEMIIGDFDSDGDVDLHNYPGNKLDNEFWRNNGSGVFSKVTGAQNPFNNLEGKAAFSSAAYAYVNDWDNDGDVDILVTKRGNTSVRDYHRNDNGVYTILTGAANPFNNLVIPTDNQMIFGDFDSDGDIDMHISDGTSVLVFYRNNGSGVFTKITGSANPFNSLPNAGAFYNDARKAFVADWDNDTDVDVFTTEYNAVNQKYYFVQNDAPPRVTSSSPANLAVNVAVDGNIALTFNHTVTAAAGKNIRIRRSDNNAVFATIPVNSAQVTGNGTSIITINPAADLTSETGYYITIDKASFVDSEGRIFMGVSNNAMLRFTTGTPLPVTLTNFTVSKKESAAELIWGTSSEVNSSHFEIQRSAEAKVWETIATVASRNENAAIQHYSFTDTAPLHAENFYRLRMVDTDGTFALSKIQSASFPDSDEQIRSYPNPVTDRIFLNTANAGNIKSVEIYSASGTVHYSGKYTRAGIDVKSLPAGTFILKTTSSKLQVSTFHFVKY